MKLKIKDCDIRPTEVGCRPRTTSRIYIWLDNDKRDKPVMDIVTGFRYNKPHQVYKEQLIPKILKRMGCPDAKVRWSQYAGCSCPCSPGFIVTAPNIEPKEVFVTAFNTQPEMFQTE